MGVTVTPLAAEPLSIKCRICGRKAPRGAKLCAQCKAAVKRARRIPHVVSRFLPLGISGPASDGREDGRRGAKPTRRARWFAVPAVPGVWGACVAIVVFGLAVAVTAYFAVQEIEDDPERLGVVGAGFNEPRAEPRAAPATDTRDPLVLRPPAEATETATDAYAGAARVAVATPMVAAKPSPRIAAADPKWAKPVMPSSDARQETTPRESDVARDSAAETGGSTPVAKLAPAAIDQTPSARDRWQAMNAELARCSGANFIARVLCDQRTRWRYCQGYWGQVSQCPAASRVDAGR